jgi:hypothetical protein
MENLGKWGNGMVFMMRRHGSGKEVAQWCGGLMGWWVEVFGQWVLVFGWVEVRKGLYGASGE